MTLKELLDKVSFDEVKPYLLQYLGHPPYDFFNDAGDLHKCREAYDRLAITEPDPSTKGEKVFIEDLMEAPWEKQVSKTVSLSDNEDLAERAALALWQLTYFGWSKKQISQRIESWHEPYKPINKYDDALERLKDSIFDHQTPRAIRSRDKNGQRCYRVPNPNGKNRKRERLNKMWWKEMFREHKVNRIKRMRKHRQEELKKYLKSMAAKQAIFDRLTANGSTLSKDDMNFIFGIHGTQDIFFAITPSKPLQYIYESITRYAAVPFADNNNCVAFVEIPRGWQVSEEDLSDFKTKIIELSGYSDILFGHRIYDDTEMRVTILLNKQ